MCLALDSWGIRQGRSLQIEVEVTEGRTMALEAAGVAVGAVVVAVAVMVVVPGTVIC